jgi:glycine dehydrogenase subunit 1
MAQRINKRTRALIAGSLHPQYRKVIETYTRNMDIELESVGFDNTTGRMDFEELKSKLDGDTIAVICQSPNYFGVVEDFQAISDAAHEKDALSIAVITEALSLGLLKPPGEMGADIVTGEAQSFGIPLGFGGPFLGFMATARKFIRQFPGRIAGQTRDVEGKRGFVLTLSTREQHIRRERATSNICTNQAHCALRATIYLETLGREGLRELARLNLLKARYAAARLQELGGVSLRFSGPVFNEFTIRLDRPWREVEKTLREYGILGGLGLEGFTPDGGGCALVCVTERHSRADIDRLAEGLKSALGS